MSAGLDTGRTSTGAASIGRLRAASPLTQGVAIAGASAVLWLAVTVLVGPYLIRQAYVDGLPLVGGLLSGQDSITLAEYLADWWSLVWGPVGAASYVFLSLGIWAVLLPAKRRRAVHWVVGGDPSLGPAQVLWLSSMAGLVGGLAEAVYVALRQAVTTRPAAGFQVELLWMAPLSALLAGASLGLLFWALAAAGQGRVGAWKLLSVLSFIAIHGLVQSEGIPLFSTAEIILSLGLASVAARAATARPAGLAQFIRVGRPVLVLLILALLGLGWASSPKNLEGRAAAGLPPAAGRLPNILVVILDTVRAANLSLYGYDRPTTPSLDAWAESGVTFDRAIAPSSWTLPSHATLFTGEHNHVLGTDVRQPLSADFVTLAESLGELGYATSGFAANYLYTTSMSGLAQGFHRYEDHPIGARQFFWSSWASATILMNPLVRGLSGLYPGSPSRDAWRTTAEFLDWLEERDPARPFFAFLNYFDAHEPYVVPDAWSATFAPPPSTTWAEFRRLTNEADASRDALAGELERWIGRYDAAIAYIDHNLGVIREQLSEHGLLETTLVVVASDHGEMWGEHGEFSHKASLHFPLIHVPLLIAFPGTVPGGVRVDVPVSLRDVPRTISELAQLPSSSSFPGSSLADLWAGSDRRDPVLAELEPGDDVPPTSPSALGPMRSLVAGDLQYILNGDGSEELYDIGSDPLGESNVVDLPDLQDAVLSFREMLRGEATGVDVPR